MTANISDEEFQKLWMMGMTSERTLGRPKEWDGKEPGFDEFSFKFTNWLSGMPGDVEALLENAVIHSTPVTMAGMNPRQKIIARGVNQALRSLIADSKALNIVKQVQEKGNGFEAWRLLHKEYKPQIAGQKVSLLDQKSKIFNTLKK